MDLLLMISISCAIFIYMIDFGMGKPGSDTPSFTHLLSFWPLFLAKMALGEKYDKLHKQYTEGLINADGDILQRKRIENEFHKVVFDNGRDLFYWEKIIGMCPICTHFWFSLIIMGVANIFFLKVNFIIFTLYFLIGHLSVRLLTKYA